MTATPAQVALPTDATERKGTPMVSGCLDYFPAALAEIARVSKRGNDQHNPGQPLHWSRGKSSDHADCILRHLTDRGTVDTDGLRHTAKVAWRALALLQEELEAAGAPVARGARPAETKPAPKVSPGESIYKGHLDSCPGDSLRDQALWERDLPAGFMARQIAETKKERAAQVPAPRLATPKVSPGESIMPLCVEVRPEYRLECEHRSGVRCLRGSGPMASCDKARRLGGK